MHGQQLANNGGERSAHLRRVSMHLGTRDKATAATYMHLTPIVHSCSTPFQPPRIPAQWPDPGRLRGCAVIDWGEVHVRGSRCFVVCAQVHETTQSGCTERPPLLFTTRAKSSGSRGKCAMADPDRLCTRGKHQRRLIFFSRNNKIFQLTPSYKMNNFNSIF